MLSSLEHRRTACSLRVLAAQLAAHTRQRCATAGDGRPAQTHPDIAATEHDEVLGQTLELSASTWVSGTASAKPWISGTVACVPRSRGSNSARSAACPL